jgi:outer membrane protein assembly factor BamB
VTRKDNWFRAVVILFFVSGLIMIAGFSPAGIKAEENPWPMFRHDLSHTGRSPYTGPANPNLYWAFPARDGIASSPAIASDGTIYVGAGWLWSGTSDSCLYALNPDGSLKWYFKTENGVFSSPAIGTDGTIYFGSLDKYLYAVEDSITYGKLKWKTYLNHLVFSSPAIGEDGTIYVGGLSQKFYALNPDGTIKWNFQTGWCVFSSPAISPDGVIYVGSKDENLYAFEDSMTYGKVKWNYAAGQFYDGHLMDSSPAIGRDGSIYVGTDPYGAWGQTPVPVDTVFFAVNPDGSLKWVFRMNDGAESSPAIGEDGTIYVGSYDGYLYAIEDSGGLGKLKWKFLSGGQIDGSPTIDASGIIYIGSRDSNLYALNPDGTLRWSYKTNGGIESSPSIGNNGILYFGSMDGNLYALGNLTPDVGVHSIDIPEKVKISSTYLPSITVRNYRATPQSFDVVCLIDTQGYYLYGDTVHLPVLNGGSITQATFSPWTIEPDSGINFRVTAVTLLPADDNPINDTLFKEVISAVDVPFTHGDANADGKISVTDAVYLINYLFRSGLSPIPRGAGDVNCDGNITVSDVVYLVNYLFRGGQPPVC